MTFADFIGGGTSGVIGVLNVIVVPIIITLAFLVFIWGVVDHFFIHGDEEKTREEGRQFVIWGVLGMVALFSVWSLVNILLSTLNIFPAA